MKLKGEYGPLKDFCNVVASFNPQIFASRDERRLLSKETRKIEDLLDETGIPQEIVELKRKTTEFNNGDKSDIMKLKQIKEEDDKLDKKVKEFGTVEIEIELSAWNTFKRVFPKNGESQFNSIYALETFEDWMDSVDDLNKKDEPAKRK